MFKKNNKAKKDYPPRAGAMYRAKSEKGTRYYKLSLQVDVIEKLEADDKGRIHLVGFDNDYKENNQHPDVFFQPSLPKSKGKKSSSFKKREEQEEDTSEERDEEESSDEEDDDTVPF